MSDLPGEVAERSNAALFWQGLEETAVVASSDPHTSRVGLLRRRLGLIEDRIRYLSPLAPGELPSSYEPDRSAAPGPIMSLFDPAHYASQAGCEPDFGVCARHYLVEGARLGCDPNPFFSTHWYARRHGLTESGSPDPLSHYLSQGADTGLATSALFDTRYYRNANPEVVVAGTNPLRHYLNTGRKVGLRAVAHRPAQDLAAWARQTVIESNLFDAEWYRGRFRRFRFGDPLVHFLGSVERPPNETFDLDHYLSVAPELVEVGVNPLLHFVVFGWRDGLSPNPDYTTVQYLVAHEGVVDADQPVSDAHGLRGRGAFNLETDYHRWHEAFHRPRPSQLASQRSESAALTAPPVISVVMPVYNPRPPFLREAIEAVLGQTWPHWELCIADDASTNPAILQILEEAALRDDRVKVVFRPNNGHICASSNSALELAAGDWVALMDHDDLIPPDALYHLAQAVIERPDAALVYSDEDIINSNGRATHSHFKSAWNEELFLRQNYINHFSMYRRSLIEQLGGFREGFEGSQDHDLGLRVVAAAGGDRVLHVPRVLYSWRQFGDSETFSQAHLHRAERARRRAAEDYLTSIDRPGQVTVGAGGFNKIRYDHDREPKVDIIIPTRDQAEVTERAVQSIMDLTTWSNFEITIVDNGSVEAETHSLFERLRNRGVRVLAYDAPFNYSAINNFAVEHTNGDLLALVNNDVEVIEPDWLSMMASYALLDHVGAVGAKLLYPNGRNQHAGVVLGLYADHPGVAGHIFSKRLKEDAGYFWRARLTQNLSAVTAACMVVARSKFTEVGGLDADNLAVAWNDINLCLDLRAAGYENVFCAEALLYHHESLSRGSDHEGEALQRFLGETEFMRFKWGVALVSDPYYNGNLGRHVKRRSAFESFSLFGRPPIARSAS